MPTAPSFVEIGLGLLLVFTLRITLVAGLATLWTRLSSWARRREGAARATVPRHNRQAERTIHDQAE
jgi:hypothetical protein